MLASSALSAKPAPQTFEEFKRHTLARFSYGPTADDLSSIQNQNDLDAWFAGQLTAPATLYTADEARWISLNLNAFQPLVAFPPTTPWGVTELERMQLYLAINSDQQLREVMTYFWESFFSTNSRTIFGNEAQQETSTAGVFIPKQVSGQASGFLFQENELYRTNALSTFRNILVASFDSAAMRAYLNVTAMYFGDPNEDYARELLELHTIGPDNGEGVESYNPVDINAMAQLLSGRGTNWDTGAPLFNDANYEPPPPSTSSNFYLFDNGANPYLDRFEVINDMDSGRNIYRLLDHLAQQTQTKHFVCNRMIEFFIGEPVALDAPVMLACVAAWDAGSGDGDIKEVLRAIWESDEFADSASERLRIKSPFEFAMSQARLLGGNVHGAPTAQAESLLRTNQFMWSSGQRLFLHPSPDGYSIKSGDQVSTAAHYLRYELASVVGSPVTNDASQELSFDLRALVERLIADDPLLVLADHQDVALAILRHGLGTRYGSLERAQVEFFLDSGLVLQPGSWDPAASDANDRIELAFAYVAALPQSFEK